MRWGIINVLLMVCESCLALGHVVLDLGQTFALTGAKEGCLAQSHVVRDRGHPLSEHPQRIVDDMLGLLGH